jgi:hypothetical protein
MCLPHGATTQGRPYGVVGVRMGIGDDQDAVEMVRHDHGGIGTKGWVFVL